MAFGFSRAETNAFIILLPLMAVIMFSEPAYRALMTGRDPDLARDQARLDSLVAAWDWSEEPQRPAIMLANFDPNTASTQELERLGLSSAIANRIVRYREKGGKFRFKSDLSKMYGIDSPTFQKLRPHIQLADRPILSKKNSAVVQKSEIVAFDLNLADTTMMKTIFGIGPITAKRIVNYRTRLGGYVSFGQLYEVWGLDSVVIDRLVKRSFIDQAFVPRKLAVNLADEKELSGHPYLSAKTARAIAVYRFQHGPFRVVEDLQGVNLLQEKTFLRIKPYLTLD